MIAASEVDALRKLLDDSTLFRELAYIDGEWCEAQSGARTAVINPATQVPFANVPYMGAIETRRAIQAASRAQPGWAALTAKQRGAILRKWHDLILAHQNDLAVLMTAEQGKPLGEARSEIGYAASFIDWFSEEGKRLYGDIIPAHQFDKRILVLRQAIGVVGAITPWNFPAAMITRKVAPALAAGCTIVCKPAPETPLSALALAALAERAAIPPGVLNMVTGNAVQIGSELTSNDLVRKITFTGSTATGKKLMEQCAPTLKKVSLELGGNAPFIVFDDADLEAAVEGAIASKFRNTGQTCVCANRILVQHGIYDAFARRLADAARKLRVGSGLEAETDQGPLISARALEKVQAHIADAQANGARVLEGGRRHRLGGLFFEPTVLTEARQTMLIAREETFGPVAALFRFGTEDQAIALANDTEFGLAAYCYTRDLARAIRVSERLAAGMVGLNTGMISTEVAPFGGVKHSGIGREGSRYGILDYTEMKYVCIGLSR